MSIGAITMGEITGEKPSAPLFAIDVSFAGDSSYPTGGTADFQESVRDAIETYMAAQSDANVRGRWNVEIQCVAGFNCGQYVPWYDAANDKLYVRDGGHATWDEVANTTNLSGTTFNLTLLCK